MLDPNAIGAGFALIVLAEWGVRTMRPRMAAKRQAREECARLGHQYGDPFGSDLGRHRNCRRCNHQQHWHTTTQEWK